MIKELFPILSHKSGTMSFFSKFTKSKELPSNWNTLSSVDQWEDVVKRSFDRPVALFKHSTRCSVSFFVHGNLTRDWDLNPEEAEFFYLDLIAHRDISNRISMDLGVHHESPQLILIHQGTATYHSSHSSISVDDLRKSLPA